MNKSAGSNDPSHILQIGMGFLASKTLLSAVELELFTHLGAGAMSGAEIGTRLGLHPRSLFDFLDALVSLGILERDGDGPTGRYSNTPQSAAFLDKKSPAYVGGILEMANARLYRFWGDLTTALKTGQPQSEIKTGGGSPFEALYADEKRLEQFLTAMQGVQSGNFRALAAKVDLSAYGTLLDIGGANGFLSTVLARKYPNLNCISFDLPQVAPIARRRIAEAGFSERIKVVPGNFFTDVLPRADVIHLTEVLAEFPGDAHFPPLNPGQWLETAREDHISDGGLTSGNGGRRLRLAESGRICRNGIAAGLQQREAVCAAGVSRCGVGRAGGVALQGYCGPGYDCAAGVGHCTGQIAGDQRLRHQRWRHHGGDDQHGQPCGDPFLYCHVFPHTELLLRLACRRKR